MSKKLSEEEKSVLEQFMIPFFHVGKRLPLFPGKNDPEVEPALLGISGEELELFRKNLDENAKQAALELLKEDEIVDLIDQIPFDGEETIAVLGDSISEDAQGWFTILKHVLEISVEKAAFTFINAGVSYNTSADALRRIDRDILMSKPDWVFVALGTFDAQRLNVAQNRTLMPLSETWENLNTIQEILEENVETPIVWITPPPVISELLESNPIYDFTISEEDLGPVREVVSGKRGVMVDPQGARMGKAPDAWNYIGDGLHPSLSGHINTVRSILKMLSQAEV